MAQSPLSLGRAELEILQYVVDRNPIRVGEVAEHFAGAGGKARTTILTVMERLRTKGYGRRFLEALPPAPLVADLGAVAEFLGASQRATA